jgi:hypothetical protein
VPTAPLLHAVFCTSAAGNLLGTGLPRRSIITLDDDLSTGPIDRTDGESRLRWAMEQLRAELVSVEQTDMFWAEVASRNNRIVAWVSRRSAREYAGLLAVVSGREDRPLDIVDVTDVEFIGEDGKPDPEMSFGIGGAPCKQIRDLKLAERAEPLSPTVATNYRQTWARLKQENALLRVVDGGGLASASITHFDSQLRSHATTEWENTEKVIGAFYRSCAAAESDRPGYWFLRSRLVAMVEAGALEGKGDFSIEPPHHRDTWVRRSSA